MSAPAKIALEARGLTKRFAGLVSVDHVSFRLVEGEILGLIGPNGAGKTTLVNMISGTLRPSEGELYFEGQRIEQLQAIPLIVGQYFGDERHNSRSAGCGQARCRCQRARRDTKKRHEYGVSQAKVHVRCQHNGLACFQNPKYLACTASASDHFDSESRTPLEGDAVGHGA